MSEFIDRARRRTTGVSAVAAAALGLAGAVWWSGTLATPESLLAQGYEAAIADSEASLAGRTPLTPVAVGPTPPKRINAIWPGSSDAQSLTFHRPLKIGDRITISSRNGKPDRLAVVELEEVDGGGIGAPGVRFQLVTSRQDGAPEGALVRFLIAVDSAPAPTASDKTL